MWEQLCIFFQQISKTVRRFSDQKTSKTLDERGDLKEEEFSEYEFVVFGEQDSADIRQ